MMSNLYVLIPRILNEVLWQVYKISVITHDGYMIEINTIISRVCFIQISCVQQLPVAIYSALVIKIKLKFTFLLTMKQVNALENDKSPSVLSIDFITNKVGIQVEC